MLIFQPDISNRSRFIFKLILQDRLGIDFHLTSSPEEFQAYPGPKIWYDKQFSGSGLFIPPTGLLSETDIRPRVVSFFDFNGIPAFFEVSDQGAAIPFDIFSAAFYLVTRYEEYLPFTPDEYGRFPADQSIAHQAGFLHLPVVDLWIEQFRLILEQNFPGISNAKHHYQFIPTIDIDHAWAFRGRSLLRCLGGAFHSVLRREKEKLKMRMSVMSGKRDDPFDVYNYICDLHGSVQMSLRWFVLFADRGGDDNNVSVKGKAFRKLLKDLDKTGITGSHPSLYSNKDFSKLWKEISALSEVLDRPIEASRQHFLWISFPETYRNLVKLGIKDDFSMGYPSTPGFRAGISAGFPFFDLLRNEESTLVIHPVQMMDVTLRDYMHLNPEEAIEIIHRVIDQVRSVNGEFVSAWHNESLSEYDGWEGWRKVYEELVRYAV
jgi:hypothetical protein